MVSHPYPANEKPEMIFRPAEDKFATIWSDSSLEKNNAITFAMKPTGNIDKNANSGTFAYDIYFNEELVHSGRQSFKNGSWTYELSKSKITVTDTARLVVKLIGTNKVQYKYTSPLIKFADAK